MDLIFATHNQNKVNEVKAILKDINIVSLKDLNDFDEVEETGATFQENAFLKANYYYQKYHQPCFADDSGLVIPSLKGEPGINSARYGGEHGNYLKNNLLVLEKMKYIKERQAYFITVICYINKDGIVNYFEGRLNGEINFELKGNNGFGYDSIFKIPSLNKNLAELPNEAKNSLSHRFLALKELINHLQKEVNIMENNIIEDVKKILKAENVKIVERLMGGMSNYTYVVEADNVLYTFRIPGEYAENFVDRNIEKANIAIIEKLNITNETIYLNVEDGKKIARYVEGKPLSQLGNYPYEKVADLLKVIHNSNLQAVNDYQPFLRLTKYENINKELGYVHPAHYFELKEQFLKFKPFLESQKKVLCHGDSQPSNFILNNEKLLVVDFEFCANNDPLYDIACFANKKYEDGLELLNVYYKNPTFDQIERFHLWRCFQCLQWYNVAVFKELKGMSKTLHIDFKKVAEHYLELVEMLLGKIADLNKNK